MPIPIILLIIFGLIVGMAIAVSTNRATRAGWTVAAERLGLEITPGGMLSNPRIDGHIEHLGVSVHKYTKGGGNNQQVFTRYQVDYPAIDLGLDLTRQTTVGGFFRRMVGMQDVEIGDSGFDEAFVVKTVDPEGLAAFLTANRRATLGNLLTAYPSLKVTDSSVRVDVRRIVRDPEVLVSTVRRLVGVAQSLGGSTPEIERAAEARASGDLSEALRRMREAVENAPDDVERRLQEIDTLAAADQTGDLGLRVDELEQLAPADPYVAGWRQSVSRPAVPRKEPAAEAGPTIDAAAATQDLFAGRQLSFTVQDKFAAGYAGGRVHWSGAVKSARSYDFDHDFGTGPGVKVVVTVASLDSGAPRSTPSSSSPGLAGFRREVSRSPSMEHSLRWIR
jgi:hypothetical protein